MLPLMAIGAAVGSGLGILSKMEEDNQKKQALAQFKKASRIEYASIKDSTILMKDAVDRATLEYAQEVSRDAGATQRDLLNDIQVQRSKMLASNEGITAGLSKAREAMVFEVKASQVENKLQQDTTSAIGRVIDNRQKLQNQLNNQLLQAHRTLQANLAKTIQTTSPLGYLGAAIGGANTGLNFTNTLNKAGGLNLSGLSTSSVSTPSVPEIKPIKVDDSFSNSA